MTVSVDLYMWHKKTKVQALLNSGATENFIDQRAITLLGLGTQKLKVPRMVLNVDGTVNKAGTITHYCTLWIMRGEQCHNVLFYITNLGRNRFIFGHPWFTKFC